MSREVFYLVVCGVLWVLAAVLGAFTYKGHKNDADSHVTAVMVMVFFMLLMVNVAATLCSTLNYAQTLPSAAVVQPEVKVDAK